MANLAYLDKVRNAAEDAYGHARGLRDETERKVFEALNNKNWGASSTTLNDIARETYSYEKFQKIFKLIWEAADSPPRNWRKVFKALMLCEYLVKNGCERCVDEIRDHSFRVRQLQDFNYYEEKLDRGQGVRDKAMQLKELLADNDVVRDARANAKRLRDKFVGHGSSGRYGGQGGGSTFGSHFPSSNGYSDNSNSSVKYSDSGEPNVGGSSERTTSLDALGRYDSEPATEPNPGNQAPLRIKPKLKMMARTKMASGVPEGDVAYAVPMASESRMKDLFTEPTPEMQQVRPSNTAGTVPNAQLLRQDLAFDPRGEVTSTDQFQLRPFAAFDMPMQPLHSPELARSQAIHPFSSTMAPPPPQPQTLVQFQTHQQAPALVQQPGALSGPIPGPNFSVEHVPAIDDFGEFAASPNTVPNTVVASSVSTREVPGNDLNSLCSLDSLTLNKSSSNSPSFASCQAIMDPCSSDKLTYAQHTAFTGLDGFSTAPQPMRSTTPIQPSHAMNLACQNPPHPSRPGAF